MDELQAAVRKGAAPDVRRLAHSCAGASATCGMRRLVALLRELEHLASEDALTGAPRLYAQVRIEFERVCQFLQKYLAGQIRLTPGP
jgi:HPt (histidine-containing phosphotransfer) domain-containing protein